VTTLEEVARVVTVQDYPPVVLRSAVANLGLVAAPVELGAEHIEELTETEIEDLEQISKELYGEPRPQVQARAEPKLQPRRAPGRERPLVLVVDDAQEILQLVSMALEDDYEIHTAEDGLDGLNAVDRLRPDLVVLDVMMPRMSGYEVCGALKEKPDTQDIPVLMLSARGEKAHVKKGFYAGADDYLPKPFDPEELLLRSRALLRRAGWRF
jgi:CheY-like chemotaxis protein